MTTPLSTADTPEFHSPDLPTDVGEKLLSQSGSRDLLGAANELVARGRDALRKLPRNVGDTDQKIRVIGGLALLAAAPFVPLSRPWKIAMGVLGASAALSGSARYCPLWHALDIDTTD